MWIFRIINIISIIIYYYFLRQAIEKKESYIEDVFIFIILITIGVIPILNTFIVILIILSKSNKKPKKYIMNKICIAKR